jgi:uncharacterized membrane protein
MDYIYIKAWGRMMGSYDYYITGEVEKARQENAPPTAVYKSHEGVWRTYEDIERSDTKALITNLVKEMTDA